MSKPKEEFRGWWIPIEITKEFQNGSINAFETLLLATIDSLVTEDRGCWASNRYLAEKMCSSEDKITRAVSKLKDLKLLKQLHYNGRIRTLETCWSRASVFPDSGKPPSQSRKNPESDSRKDPSPSHRVSKGLPKGRGTGRTNRPSPSPKGFLLNDWDRKGGALLRGILVHHDSDLVQPPKQVSLDTLAKCFARLRTERKIPKPRIKQLLKWLSDHYGDDYVPRIRKGDDFSRRFVQFEEAMRRWEVDNEVYEGNGEAEEPIPWDGCTEKQALTADVRDWLVEYDGRYDPQVRGKATDRQVEKALVALGREGEEVDRSIT